MNLARGKSLLWIIHRLLDEQNEVSSGQISAAAGVTRQAAHYHLKRLVEAGQLEPVSAGRTRRYRRKFSWFGQLDTQGLEEHTVWNQLTNEVADFSKLNEDALKIARFAFTEMLNNAIDHSGSEQVRVTVTTTTPLFNFLVSDEGVGAFEHVRKSKGLEDHIAAIQELSKGKLTTDPARHSGEGIFFTSKSVDRFSLSSNGWTWTVDNLRDDEAIGAGSSAKGTQVEFEIDPNTQRSLRESMDAYTDPDTFDFSTSRTVVRLFELDLAFVSRSEAKRLTRNLDQFAHVIVDFRGVDEIGQAFADEIFRVWQSDHPETRLVPVNMNEAVMSMVERARVKDGGK